MIKEKMQADQLQALKSGDKKRLETLRYIVAQIKYKEIEKKGDLTDEEVVSLLRKQLKEVSESAGAFKKGGREDLLAETEAQKEIIYSYLPAEMSDEELTKEIEKIITSNKELYDRDKKAIIGICMKELKSKVDPSRIMKILSSL